MIKIPGTKESIPAVRAALEKGLNVNITLLFSVESLNFVTLFKSLCHAPLRIEFHYSLCVAIVFFASLKLS